MYSLDLKAMNKVIYSRENSLVQATICHDDELVKLLSRPAGPVLALGRVKMI